MIKGSEPPRPEGRRVMQPSEAKGEDTRAAGRKGGREEGLLLQVGIQLSRNVLMVEAYTIREGQHQARRPCYSGGSSA